MNVSDRFHSLRLSVRVSDIPLCSNSSFHLFSTFYRGQNCSCLIFLRINQQVEYVRGGCKIITELVSSTM